MSRTRGKEKSAIDTAMGDAIPPWQERLLANIQADIERRRKLWPLMAQLWSVPYGKRGKTKHRKGYFYLIENRIMALGYSIDELDDIFRYELWPVLWKMQWPYDNPENWLWLRPWRCISLMRRRRMPVEELEQRILENVHRPHLFKRTRRLARRIRRWNSVLGHLAYAIGLWALVGWDRVEFRWDIMTFGLNLVLKYRGIDSDKGCEPKIVRTDSLYVDESLASLKAGPLAPLDARQVVILAFAHAAINKTFKHGGPYFVTPVYDALVDLSVTASQFEQIWQEDIKGKMEDFAISLSPGPRPLSAGALLDAAEAHIANHKAGRVPASDRKLNPMRTKPLYRLLYSLLEAREYCFGHINGDKFLADRVGFSDTLARRRQAWKAISRIYTYLPLCGPFPIAAQVAKELYQLDYSRAEIKHMLVRQVRPNIKGESPISEFAIYDPTYEAYEPYMIRSVHKPKIWGRDYLVPQPARPWRWHVVVKHFDKLSKAAKTDKK